MQVGNTAEVLSNHNKIHFGINIIHVTYNRLYLKVPNYKLLQRRLPANFIH